MKKLLVVCVVAALPGFAPASQERILTTAEAKSHVGETATVCGKVVGTRYLESSRGQPTFLNFDRPYPKTPFTVVIWGSDRAKFNEPEKTYLNKQVCVTGKLQLYRDTPEIIATAPAQVRVQEPK